jgi:molecular chaperone DnaK
VTFDIDANGILNVSARDKDTGAEQRITISESSNLDKAEVERMIREAQQHQAEDAQLRQQIDARNALDSMAHRVEQRIGELGDQLPVHTKARAEGLVADARQAMKEEAPTDRLRSIAAELEAAYHSLVVPSSVSEGAQAGGNGGAAAAGDDDVIDADFTVG